MVVLKEDVVIIKRLFNMASITPRQIIENIGDKFGLTAPEDNPFLDEYYLNGQPLDNVWANAQNSGEADEMLSSIENDLLGEAITLDDSTGQEGYISEDGIESASIKKDTKTFRQTVTDAFRRRK